MPRGRSGSPILPGTIPRRSTTLAGFVTLGLFWGAWASVLPSVQDATGVSKGALGVAMLFVSLGSIPAMFFVAAPLVDRFGARAVAFGAAAFAAASTLPGLASSFPLLVVTLTAAGMASGVLDVSINANAGRIESVTKARLMPLAHGLYSVGVLAGAVGAGLARNAGAGREPILLAVSACVALTAVAAAGDRAPVHTEPSRGIRLARSLIVIGLIGAAAFVVEGGIESWSALFLARVHHADPAVSGLGPGVFAASMAAGRFLGQAARRFDDRVLLSAGAAGSVAGCMLAAASPSATLALVGFAIAGAGVSLNAPIVFGLAGRRPDAATAVATVTTIGYVGLLVGPPLVGLVAQATSLRVSFAVLAAIGAAVAVAATRKRRRRRPLQRGLAAEMRANREGHFRLPRPPGTTNGHMRSTRISSLFVLAAVLLAAPAAQGGSADLVISQVLRRRERRRDLRERLRRALQPRLDVDLSGGRSRRAAASSTGRRRSSPDRCPGAAIPRAARLRRAPSGLALPDAGRGRTRRTSRRAAARSRSCTRLTRSRAAPRWAAARPSPVADLVGYGTATDYEHPAPRPLEHVRARRAPRRAAPTPTRTPPTSHPNAGSAQLRSSCRRRAAGAARPRLHSRAAVTSRQRASRGSSPTKLRQCVGHDPRDLRARSPSRARPERDVLTCTGTGVHPRRLPARHHRADDDRVEPPRS